MKKKSRSTNRSGDIRISDFAPRPDANLLRAFEAHKAGRLEAAETAYLQVLASQPEQIDALNNLASLHFQRGRYADGVSLAERSLGLRPTQPLVALNLGNAYKELGRAADALPLIDRALAEQPDFPPGRYARGNVLCELGRHAEAVADYLAALAAHPDYVQARFNLGNTYKTLGQLDAALACYDDILSRHPDYAPAQHNRAWVQHALGHADAALADCQQVVDLRPDDAGAHYNLGNAWLAAGHAGEALASFDAAVRIQTDHAPAWNNRGNALRRLGRLEAALASYELAMEHAPEHADAYHNYAGVLARLCRHDEALEAFEAALELDPALPYAAGAAQHCRLQLCDWSGYAERVAELVAGVERGDAVITPFQFLALPSNPALQAHCAARYVAEQFPRVGTRPQPPEEPGGRVRLGFFSSDFREHPMANLIVDLIGRLDRSRFIVHGYALAPSDGSPARRKLEAAFDRLDDLFMLDDDAAVALARSHGLDIAIDLNGHTAGERGRLFAAGLAPVQVAHLGYPGSCGAPYIDYLIADASVVPASERVHYSEHIVELPDTYWFDNVAREVAASTPSRADLGLPDDGFVFCCFNNAYKLSPDVFDLWMRLLQDTQGSVLWLLHNSDQQAANLAHEAGARGVDPGRLVFAPRAPLAEHLARQRAADLFLDTFHYNAHTTASDALLVGLPLVTLRGPCFAGRVAASLLAAAGLPELITDSPDAYFELARELASDPARLASVRERLASARDQAPLFDGARYARNLENAYAAMHARRLAGQPADTLVIEALDPVR